MRRMWSVVEGSVSRSRCAAQSLIRDIAESKNRLLLACVKQASFEAMIALPTGFMQNPDIR
jgi:hypothetical protein